MKKTLISVLLLWLAALLYFATSTAHMACLYLGPECFKAQLAPDELVVSAREGTWLAPVATVVVSGVFVTWGLYALAGLYSRIKLPWVTAVVYLIGAVCIIRGILPIQLWVRLPERVETDVLLWGVGWLIAGASLTLGYFLQRRASATSADSAS